MALKEFVEKSQELDLDLSKDEFIRLFDRKEVSYLDLKIASGHKVKKLAEFFEWCSEVSYKYDWGFDCVVVCQGGDADNESVDSKGRPFVWDGGFQVRYGFLYFSGYEGPSGYGKGISIKVRHDDMICVV